MPSPTLHLRAPLLWVLIPLMAGLVAARFWQPPACGLGPLALALGSLAIAAGFFAGASWRWATSAWGGCLAVSVALGGFILLHARHPTPRSDPTRPPREITVTVTVRQTFPSAQTARQISGLATITVAAEVDRELTGQLVYFSAIRRISVFPHRSGQYRIRGVIEPLPQTTGDAGFNDYLANLGVHRRLMRAHVMTEVAPPGRFPAFCARAQDRLERILRHGLPEKSPVASLYLAMLLGEKAVLSTDQENAYMRSGTFHIFSISGLHVGVIAGALLVTGQWLRVPRRWSTLASLTVLWFYVQVTGASAPAMRSFIMIAFMTSAQTFRLPGNHLAALVAAAITTLVWDPLQLFSTGFQMSYSVVVALVTMGRPLSEKWAAAWQPFAMLPRDDWRWHHHQIAHHGRKLAWAAAGCWTAFLASTPSGIGYFELFTPGSLLANLLIVPLSSFVIWAGFVSLLAGLAGLLPVSAACNLLAERIILTMDWLLQHGTAFPAAWFTAHYRTEWLAPASLVLMTAVFLAGSAGRWRPRYGGYWLPAGALALLVLFGVKFG